MWITLLAGNRLPSNAELQTITTDEQVTTDDDAADSLVAVAVVGSLPVRLLQQLVTAAAATAAYSPGWFSFYTVSQKNMWLHFLQ